MEENAGFREGETRLQQIKREVFLKNAPIACNQGKYGAFFLHNSKLRCTANAQRRLP
jgi:hypothetical protein